MNFLDVIISLKVPRSAFLWEREIWLLGFRHNQMLWFLAVWLLLKLISVLSSNDAVGYTEVVVNVIRPVLLILDCTHPGVYLKSY